MAFERFIGTRDLHNTSSLLRDISASGETCYITEDGKAKAVLMDINRYNALMDIVEETESFRDYAPSGQISQDFSVHSILRNSTRVGQRR
ncbi:MAG: hypothetical protein V1899_09050 [Planctomycetota bacterium]